MEYLVEVCVDVFDGVLWVMMLCVGCVWVCSICKMDVRVSFVVHKFPFVGKVSVFGMWYGVCEHGWICEHSMEFAVCFWVFSGWCVLWSCMWGVLGRVLCVVWPWVWVVCMCMCGVVMCGVSLEVAVFGCECMVCIFCGCMWCGLWVVCMSGILSALC